MARLLLILVCLFPFVVSCVSTPNPFDQPRPGERNEVQRMDLMVRVENDHYDPVIVSAVWPNQRHFLGEVPPGGTEIFSIPGHILDTQGGPRFLADPRGSTNEQLTDPIDCVHARWVRWKLKRHLLPSRPVVLSP